MHIIISLSFPNLIFRLWSMFLVWISWLVRYVCLPSMHCMMCLFMLSYIFRVWLVCVSRFWYIAHSWMTVVWWVNHDHHYITKLMTNLLNVSKKKYNIEKSNRNYLIGPYSSQEERSTNNTLKTSQLTPTDKIWWRYVRRNILMVQWQYVNLIIQNILLANKWKFVSENLF